MGESSLFHAPWGVGQFYGTGLVLVFFFMEMSHRGQTTCMDKTSNNPNLKEGSEINLIKVKVKHSRNGFLGQSVLIMKSSRTETRIKSGFSPDDIRSEYGKMIDHKTALFGTCPFQLPWLIFFNNWVSISQVPQLYINPNPRIRLSVCVCVTKRPHLTHYPQANTLSTG